MCCVRFTISASYRKEVERHLKIAQHLGHLRQVKYLKGCTKTTFDPLRAASNLGAKASCAR